MSTTFALLAGICVYVGTGSYGLGLATIFGIFAITWEIYFSKK